MHAKRRASQRYGVVLNDDAYRHLIWSVQNGRGKFVERQSITRTVWDVIYREQTMRVIYSSSRKNIVTVLPPELITEQNDD